MSDQPAYGQASVTEDERHKNIALHYESESLNRTIQIRLDYQSFPIIVYVNEDRT